MEGEDQFQKLTSDLSMCAHTIIINKVNKNKRPFPLNVPLRRQNSLSGNVTGRGWREGSGFRALACFAENGCLQFPAPHPAAPSQPRFDVYTRKMLSAGCRVLAHFCFCRVCTATLTSEVRGQSITWFSVITTGKPLWGKLSKIYVVDWILLQAFLRSVLILIAESI